MDNWKLIYDGFDPDRQPLREALCTLGNGYFATRGAAEEMDAGGPHYPGTYLAGGYNRLKTEVSGRVIENEDLVNFPNWLCLDFKPVDGDWLDLGELEVLEYRQVLDLKCGLLERKMRVKDPEGRQTSLCSRRLVHMDRPNLAAIEWTLTPENWSGEIVLRSALDGTVANLGVERYRDLAHQHLEPVRTGLSDEESIYLEVRTNQSHLQMAQAARTRIFSEDELMAVERSTEQQEGWVAQEIRTRVERARPLRVEKVVAIHTSRDFAISEPVLESRKQVHRAGSFERLLETHTEAWARLWHRCDVDLGRENEAQLILRLHIFHLLQTVSPNSIDQDVGVPARGWHGEAYRGHIFWDELFIFPFLNLRIPDLTRSLLLYRYRRLPEARQAAKEAGYRGAMYPWQSGSNGREESQVLHLNPRSGNWIPDDTHLQRHIGAAVAYNVWQYYQSTWDREFLADYGAEMILDIARFWASIASYDAQSERYDICGVVGPDEYHTGYPDSDERGLCNNAYTNVMAVWVLRCALRVLDELPADRRGELRETLDLSDDEIARWDDVSRRMRLCFLEDGILSQFEGYDELEELDWEGYREKYDDIQRLDRILEAEDDDPDRYKASKQADVLMLFYLFSCREELESLFERLGYDFDRETVENNIRYYLQRTSHGSTLSRVVHSWVLSRWDRERSWTLFREALESDVADIQGGTTPEGIHLGAMAGTVDLVQRCYTGLEVREDILWLDPRLPESLDQLGMRIHYRDHWLRLHLTRDRLRVTFERGPSPEVELGVRDRTYRFEAGQEREIELEA